MSIKVTDLDSWIFVNYPPGGFGSFLTKTLESSSQVAGCKSQEIFDQYFASHYNVSIWIKRFHDGNDLEKWAMLDPQSREQYILDHAVQDLPLTIKKVFRLTVPKINSIVRQHFSKAKFVKVTVDSDDLDMIAYYMAQKTFDVWFNQRLTPGSDLKKILSNVKEQDQKIFYQQECKKRVCSVIDNSREQNTYNFPFKSFLTRHSFITEVNDLFDWLCLDKIDCVNLYNMFFDAHNGFSKQ